MRNPSRFLPALALLLSSACSDAPTAPPPAKAAPAGVVRVGDVASARASIDGYELLGGLDVLGYCRARGYNDVGYKKGYIAGRPQAAYNNWVCQMGFDQGRPEGANDLDITDACNATYNRLGVFAVAQDPDHAWSWACFVDPRRVVYDFDDLSGPCALNAVLPATYRDLVFPGGPPKLAPCIVRGTNKALVPLDWAKFLAESPSEIRIRLPRAARSVTIQHNDQGAGVVTVASKPTLNAYDAHGSLVTSSTIAPGAGGDRWTSIDVSGDIHEIGLAHIYTRIGVMFWDNLAISYDDPRPSDATPPVVAANVTGTTGANGWYTSDVQVAWSVTDAESAISSSTGCNATSVTADTDGTTFTCSATSPGGTANASVTIKRDATAPTVVGTVTGTQGAGGWYTSNVNVSWATSDALSGIASSTGCGPTVTSTDNTGTTYTCAVTDKAGNSTTKSVSAKRDATAPTIAFGGNLGTYTVDATVAITCAASDAMSGIAAANCPGASAPAYEFALGSSSLAAHASDNAGLTATRSTTFTVSVTTASLCELAKRWVTNPGVAASMCGQLEAAGNSAARGNANAKAGQLGAFVNHVRAQTGKTLTEAQAATLIRLAGAL